MFKSSFADLGSYTDLVHDHDASKSVSVGVTLDFSDEPSVLKEFTNQTGLKLINSETKISFRTNFVSGSTAREGIVGSIEAAVGDERLVFEGPSIHVVSPDGPQDEESQALPKRFLDSGMSISPKLSIGYELYELIVEPLVKLALSRLVPKMDELRSQMATAPDADPSPKLGKGRFRVSPLTKADFQKTLRSHEKLSSILATYTVEGFKRDFEAAVNNVRADLRGCLLDRTLVTDQNTGILYPNFERLGGKSGFYADKFIELLTDELVDDEFSHGMEESYTQRYYSIATIWLLQLVLLGSDVYRRFLQRLIYIGPMRESPLRYYLPETTAGDSVGKTGQFSPTLLFQRPHLLSPVNEWLSRLKLDYELEVARFVAKPTDFEEGVFALRLKSGSRSISSSMVDVGFGVSQLLPIVIQCLVSQTSTICIEEPEIHLHPGLQAELGDLFIESALGDQKNTLILETHSEHLILRLLRRIRETTEGDLPEGARPLRPSNVQVLYVGQGSQGVVIHDLEITPEGEFAEDWPDGFFPERAKELF